MPEADTTAQKRIVGALVAGQVLAGLGQGAVISVGSLLATQVAGSEAWAGSATTLSVLGAAAAAIPLAALAQRAGRRPALALGATLAMLGSVVAIIAATIVAFPLLMVGFVLLGVGTAVGLQARFAATDAADPSRRGRDLSIVVWSTTVGSVIGPNLFVVGEPLAAALRIPDLAGSLVIAAGAQALAAIVYLVLLRPDPLVLARRLAVASPTADAGVISSRATLFFAIAALGLSHAVMVSLMAMTPVHLTGHGASLTVVGFTISLHIAGMYALSPLFGWASDKFGRIRTLLLGQSLFAGSVLTLAIGAETEAAVTVGLVLLGLGWSASTVSASALISELVTGKQRVRVQGRSDLFMNIAGGLGGALAGPVLAGVGYAGLAWIAGVLVLAVVAGALVVRARVRAT